MTTEYHTMPYIDDKTMFKAVKFAMAMRRDGLATELAISRSARYYGVAQRDVAHWLGRVGGRKRAKNAIWNAYHEGERAERQEYSPPPAPVRAVEYRPWAPPVRAQKPKKSSQRSEAQIVAAADRDEALRAPLLGREPLFIAGRHGNAAFHWVPDGATGVSSAGAFALVKTACHEMYGQRLQVSLRVGDAPTCVACVAKYTEKKS
jgi:hypothetical protein